ncbi:hypothetical protein L2E82_28588 [Cichorium intybus]|uniref:Uncharacterized protein n=1 Tax=Cichorium intybus TaxID=13427 RepID=A0ACB9CWT2_CICIN|nr:hypothetical protein L2E82_28588 [Cichorium intybus]
MYHLVTLSLFKFFDFVMIRDYYIVLVKCFTVREQGNGSGNYYTLMHGAMEEGWCGVEEAEEKELSNLSIGDHEYLQEETHPQRFGLISATRFQSIAATKKEGKLTLNLKQSEKVLYELEPIDQQLAVTFSHDGSLLAVGREYRMDEVSGFCKFSHDALNNEVIYVTAMRDQGGCIANHHYIKIVTRDIVLPLVSGTVVKPMKQIVKEGQVICYVDQLGGDLPIESDVGGQVIKILRDDCEPVGHGDALIAILPSFPGIKKLQ